MVILLLLHLHDQLGTCERVLSYSCVALLKQIVFVIIEASPEEF